MPATAKVIDFSQTKDGGRFRPVRVKEGDYRCVVDSVDDHLKEGEKTSTQWVFTIKIKGRRGTYPYYASHSDPKTAFKARNLAMACGLKVPKSRAKLDPNKLVGKEIGAAFEDDEFEGKVKSTVAAVFPVSELGQNNSSADEVDAVDEDATEPDADEDVDDLDLEEV
jgi:hypothetical protein